MKAQGVRVRRKVKNHCSKEWFLAANAHVLLQGRRGVVLAKVCGRVLVFNE